MKTHDGSCVPASSISTKRTWRHVEAPSSLVKSYEEPFVNPVSSAGRSFHCLQATSHALHPMHVVVSVKNPIRRASGLRTEISAMALRPLGRVVFAGGARVAGALARQAFGRALAAAARADVARPRLRVLDRHVRVAREHDQVIDGVAGRGAEPPPVPRQRDLV